jgi:hypothetical protein
MGPARGDTLDPRRPSFLACDPLNLLVDVQQPLLEQFFSILVHANPLIEQARSMPLLALVVSASQVVDVVVVFPDLETKFPLPTTSRR